MSLLIGIPKPKGSSESDGEGVPEDDSEGDGEDSEEMPGGFASAVAEFRAAETDEDAAKALHAAIKLCC